MRFDPSDTLRLLEALSPPTSRLRPGQLNPDDFATPEQFEKAKGVPVALPEKT